MTTRPARMKPIAWEHCPEEFTGYARQFWNRNSYLMQSCEDFETFRLLTILAEQIEIYRLDNNTKGFNDAVRSFNSFASKFKMFPKDREKKNKATKKFIIGDNA